MNSSTRQEQIRSIVEQIQTKQKEIDEARKSGAVFSEVKQLYLELKELNRQFTLVLEQVNYNPE